MIDFCIAQLADIQIRLFKRKEEYRYVFSKLEESLKENKPDLIALCGDVVHNKVSLSPESIDLVSDFLKMLASYADVYIIPGNHDLVVINRSRLDALTPIVKNINSQKIHYFTKSQLVDVNDFLTLGIFSLIDREHFPIRFNRLENRRYIALYHGALNGSIYENEQVARNPDDDVSIFENYDISLCGDIHKKQQIKNAFFAGSLVQQNYGESINKGYLLWNLKDLSHKFIKLDNKWSYNTIDLTENKELPNIELSEKPRIRVILSSPTVSEIQKIYADIRTKWNNVEEIIVKHKEEDGRENALSEIDDLSVLENIEKLLQEYLKDKTNDKTIREIIEINREMFNKVPDDFSVRNITWNLEELDFSNMFSYGKNNKIDFRNYSNNIVLISAPNRSGKSNLVSSLLQIITGKNGRVRKNCYVINNKENECYGSVIISENNKRYKIERIIKRGENRSSSTELKFCEIDGESENEPLKIDTEKLLRRMFGSYEELTLTSFSMQNRIADFVEDARESYRIKTFSKFLGLDVFDFMFNLIKDETNELESTIKTYDDLDFSKHIAENETKLRNSQRELNDIEIDIDLVSNEKAILEHDIIDLKSKIEQNDNVENIDDNINILKLEIIELNREKNDLNSALEDTIKKLDIVINEIKKYVNIDFVDSIKKLENDLELYTNKKISLESEKAILEEDNEKIKILEKQPWLYTEEICKKCDFFNQAICTKNELDNVKIDVAEKENCLLTFANTSQNLKTEREEFQRFQNLKNLERNLKSSIENDKLKIDNTSERISSKALNLNELYKTRKDNEASIENSKLLRAKNIKSQEINDKLSVKNEQLINIKSDIKLRQENIKSFKDSISKLQELETKYNTYKLYKDAIAKDGIPYIILSRSINYINNEINNILENFVNFRVKVETDEIEKDLSIMIQHEDGTEGPVEGGSGMEKTITAIAIRAALIKMSSLPKCNIFVLDEFSSTLDSKYINSIESMLNYLKNMFDVVLLISHSNEIQDVADSQINVVKSQGYSKIISN